jgi:hypothetical protein
MKNMKDFENEHHNHPIKWVKSFITGAVFGTLYGGFAELVKPQ